MTDTGPIYPPSPAPGSNAIGLFTVGVSPIGDIPPFNPWVTVISQYANAKILTGLVTSFNAAIDQTENFSNLFDNIANPATAQGYGLDVVGRIVGVSRVLELPGNVTYLGFEEASGSWTGFGQGGFYSGGGISTNYSLDDSDFRTLIYAKMLGNISDGSILSLNNALLTLFPNQGACYVVDNQNMTMTLQFEFLLTQVQAAILGQSNVLPYPAGVAVTIQQL